MLCEVQSLSNLPVKSLESGETLGYFDELIIDPENGQVLGFLVKTYFLGGRKKVVSFKDITHFGYQEILIRNEQAVTEIEEIVRVKNIIEEKKLIIGSKVITQSGKKIGKVNDFVFDTDLGVMVKIYVEKSGIWGIMNDLLIIPVQQIIEIQPGKIIIKDDFNKEELKEKEILEEPVIN